MFRHPTHHRMAKVVVTYRRDSGVERSVSGVRRIEDGARFQMKIASRWKTDRELHRRVFRVNFSISRANDQFWFQPGAFPKPFRQVIRPHHSEQCDQWNVALAEHHRALSHNCQTGLTRSCFHACELRRLRWEHAGKKSAGGEMPGGYRAVVGHRAAHLKAASEFLRMFALHAAAWRKIRWASGDEIKPFIRSQHTRFAKIAVANFIPL